MKKYIALLMLSTLTIAACKDEGHTKEWYKQHDAERKQRVEECRNDTKLEATFDCQNALDVESDIFLYGK